MFLAVPDGVPGGTVTGIWISQLPTFVGLPAGMVPPVRETEFVVAVKLPPQVVVGVPATMSGFGKLSVTFTPV